MLGTAAGRSRTSRAAWPHRPLRAVQATWNERATLAVDALAGRRSAACSRRPGQPLRHRHGSPCEQLVGVRWLDASGDLSTAGDGAPGLDLGRLLCGSQGGLGVLVSATMRVQPLPAGRVWVSRPVWTPLEVHDLLRAVLDARLDPAAIELDLPVAGSRSGRPVHTSMARHPSMTGRAPAGEVGGHPRRAVGGGPADVASGGTARRAARRCGRVGHAALDWWRRYLFRPDDVVI
jgi:glycolate oxidase FAD binding subunit